MVITVASLLLLVSALLSLWHGFRLYKSLYRFKISPSLPTVQEVPSVSVCIPARNETHAMAQCLERVLASDYEKLEILVYDDSSEDDTSMIIRSFARAGVRFVAGTELPEGWLGKNYALEILSKEASGTYVLFMDVDTIIGPSTIRRLVDLVESTNTSMVSVIPERADGWRQSVLFGHLRYFWELSLNTAARPATSSALWLINRKVFFDDLGGMESFRSTAASEAAIAAQLGPEKYQSLISTPEIEVMYEKKWHSQVETSKRLLFPRANGTRFGAFLALSSLLLLNLPFLVVLTGFIFGWSLLHLIAGITVFIGMNVYGMYTSTMWRRAWWVGTLVWPVVVLQELVLFIYSLQGYYRHTITWKGRPVSPYPRSLPLHSGN